MTINQNDPAMPYVAPVGMEDTPGLTIRTEIAARAMQGLLAHDGKKVNYSVVAFDAVKAADALISELNKPV